MEGCPMKLKKKNILVIAILAVAGLFGTASAVLKQKVNEEPVVEKAEAAATSGSATIWFTWSGSWSVDPYVSYCVGSDSWTHMTTKCGTTGYSGTGSVNVPNNTTKVIFAHRSSDGKSWWGQTANMDITIDGTKGLKNKLVITSNSASFGASWDYNTGLSNTIVYNNNTGSGSISNQQIWLDNATLNSGSSFSKSGYTLSSWNTAANGTGTSYSLSGSATYKNFPNYVNGSSVTLYAIWTLNTYTMTFKPNGGSGSQTTRSKTHGQSFTVPAPADLGIGAGVGRVMLNWADNEDGSGNTYSLDGTSTYTGNANHDFWLIQGYKSYEYSVDGGSSWVQMPRMEETPSLCVAGYESDESNYLPAGAIITFRSYYGSGAHSAQSIDIWAGNQYEESGNHHIEFGTHNKVVLTVQNDGNFKVDIYGGSERGIAITRDDFDTKYVSDLDEKSHNYSCTLTVLPGDQIRAFHSWRTVYDITMTNYASYGIDVNGNVSVPAVYTLTLTWDGTDGGYPTVDVTAMIAADTASLIAQTFNTDMTTLCEGMEKGASPSSLTSQWSTESGYYSKLTTATKNILNGTTSSSDADVLAMRAKYDRIVGKYKNSGVSINDYMSRNPASLSAIRDFSPFTLFTNDEDNLSTIIIIAASSVALLSVTALSILVIKKRKNKEE